MKASNPLFLVEKLDANALLADSDSSDPKKCRILDPNTSSATEIEVILNNSME